MNTLVLIAEIEVGIVLLNWGILGREPRTLEFTKESLTEGIVEPSLSLLNYQK